MGFLVDSTITFPHYKTKVLYSWLILTLIQANYFSWVVSSSIRAEGQEAEQTSTTTFVIATSTVRPWPSHEFLQNVIRRSETFTPISESSSQNSSLLHNNPTISTPNKSQETRSSASLRGITLIHNNNKNNTGTDTKKRKLEIIKEIKEDLLNELSHRNSTSFHHNNSSQRLPVILHVSLQKSQLAVPENPNSHSLPQHSPTTKEISFELLQLVPPNLEDISNKSQPTPNSPVISSNLFQIDRNFTANETSLGDGNLKNSSNFTQNDHENLQIVSNSPITPNVIRNFSNAYQNTPKILPLLTPPTKATLERAYLFETGTNSGFSVKQPGSFRNVSLSVPTGKGGTTQILIKPPELNNSTWKNIEPRWISLLPSSNTKGKPSRQAISTTGELPFRVTAGKKKTANSDFYEKLLSGTVVPSVDRTGVWALANPPFRADLQEPEYVDESHFGWASEEGGHMPFSNFPTIAPTLTHQSWPFRGKIKTKKSHTQFPIITASSITPYIDVTTTRPSRVYPIITQSVTASPIYPVITQSNAKPSPVYPIITQTNAKPSPVYPIITQSSVKPFIVANLQPNKIASLHWGSSGAHGHREPAQSANWALTTNGNRVVPILRPPPTTTIKFTADITSTDTSSPGPTLLSQVFLTPADKFLSHYAATPTPLPSSTTRATTTTVTTTLPPPVKIASSPTVRTPAHIWYKPIINHHYGVGPSGLQKPTRVDVFPPSAPPAGQPSGPTGSDPINHPPMNQMPVNTGPMNQRPMNSGPPNQRPSNTGPSNQRPANTGPMNQRPMNSGPSNQRPANTGPSNQRPYNSGPSNQRPYNNGPNNRRPMSSGPSNQRPMNTGSSNQAETEEETPTTYDEEESEEEERRKTATNLSKVINPDKKHINFKIWNFSNGTLELQNEKKIPTWILKDYKITNDKILNMDDLPGAVRSIVANQISQELSEGEDRRWQQLPTYVEHSGGLLHSSPANLLANKEPVSLNYVLWNQPPKRAVQPHDFLMDTYEQGIQNEMHSYFKYLIDKNSQDSNWNKIENYLKKPSNSRLPFHLPADLHKAPAPSQFPNFEDKDISNLVAVSLIMSYLNKDKNNPTNNLFQTTPVTWRPQMPSSLENASGFFATSTNRPPSILSGYLNPHEYHHYSAYTTAQTPTPTSTVSTTDFPSDEDKVWESIKPVLQNFLKHHKGKRRTTTQPRVSTTPVVKTVSDTNRQNEEEQDSTKLTTTKKTPPALLEKGDLGETLSDGHDKTWLSKKKKKFLKKFKKKKGHWEHFGFDFNFDLDFSELIKKKIYSLLALKYAPFLVLLATMLGPLLMLCMPYMMKKWKGSDVEHWTYVYPYHHSYPDPSVGVAGAESYDFGWGGSRSKNGIRHHYMEMPMAGYSEEGADYSSDYLPQGTKGGYGAGATPATLASMGQAGYESQFAPATASPLMYQYPALPPSHQNSASPLMYGNSASTLTNQNSASPLTYENSAALPTIPIQFAAPPISSDNFASSYMKRIREIGRTLGQAIGGQMNDKGNQEAMEVILDHKRNAIQQLLQGWLKAPSIPQAKENYFHPMRRKPPEFRKRKKRSWLIPNLVTSKANFNL